MEHSKKSYNLQTRVRFANISTKDKDSGMMRIKSKSCADVREHRPKLGEIHNFNKENKPKNDCVDNDSKLNIKRKPSNPFIHVKSKIDTNLRPANKTVIRKVNSTTNLDIKPKVPQAKIPVTKTLPTDEVFELTSEMIQELDMIENDEGLNPFMVTEYRKDIYNYLLSLEDSDPISENFLDGNMVNHKMRALLVSWLIDVHDQFRLLIETLHLTISILDRYLQKTKSISKDRLQLVGIGAMVLACKYEEIYEPDVNDFVYMCKSAFSKQEIRDMEYTILRALKFNLSPPLPIHFLRRYSKVNNATPIQHDMAKYFVELLLFDYTTCFYKPSAISAAALCLAIALLDKNDTMPSKVWSPALQYFSSHKFSEISVIIKKLAKILYSSKVNRSQSIAKKYDSAKYSKVSRHPAFLSVVLTRLALNNTSV